jgi:Cof subfamily protein (haloacid dehalogenase superfamily)
MTDAAVSADRTPGDGAMRPPAGRVALVVSDIDGTLVTKDKRLTPEVVGAAARLRAAGIRLALVSSRPPRGLDAVIGTLGVDEPCAGFNGGVVFRPGQSPIAKRPLAGPLAQLAVETLSRPGIDVWLFTETEWLARDPSGAYVARETRTVGFPPRFVPGFEPYLDQAFKIVGASADPVLLARAEGELRDLYAGRAAASLSQPYYLDVTDAEAHKGTAVLDIARTLGVDPQAVATIGDGANDVPMLAVAGLSIAMGNASAETQAHAHFTTTSNAESGFAAAVERFILPRAGG